jgi:hypothetical protein
MLTILLCLTHFFIPDLLALVPAIELQSAIFAFVLFGCLVARLGFRARWRAPRSADAPSVNLLSI